MSLLPLLSILGHWLLQLPCSCFPPAKGFPKPRLPVLPVGRG